MLITGLKHWNRLIRSRFTRPTARRASGRRSWRKSILSADIARSVELLEERTLLSVVVLTDKPEYVSEEPIIVTVSGFAPGKTVEFQILHTDGTSNTGSGHDPVQIVDGGQYDEDGAVNGAIQVTGSLDENDSAGSTFEVTAKIVSSGEVASASFTIELVKNSLTQR